MERRTNKEKREAVVAALRDSATANMTDSAIAALCQVTQPMVRNVRAYLTKTEGIATFTERIGRDGKYYSASKTRLEGKIFSPVGSCYHAPNCKCHLDCKPPPPPPYSSDTGLDDF